MKIVNTHPDLSALYKLIEARNPKASIERIKQFAKIYHASVPYKEFAEQNIEEVYGSTISSWNFLQKKQKDVPKVRVFNPDLEVHGWKTTHTVIQVLIKDMPFLVDSVRMEVNRRQMVIHTIHSSIFHVTRNDKGELDKHKLTEAEEDGNKDAEALIYIEIDKHSDQSILDDLERKLLAILKELRCCVDDFPKIVGRVKAMSKEISHLPCKRPQEDIDECRDFLSWLSAEHFTFLGYDEFTIDRENGTAYVVRDETKNLGILCFYKADDKRKKLEELSSEIQAFMLSESMINFFKSGMRSHIHRPAYPDYIVVKRFNKKGEVIGGVRFMGLYTSNVYLETPKEFPIIRQKIKKVWQMTGFDSNSHMGKEINRILEVYPRDELIQSSAEQLYNTAMGILNIKERKQTRVFIRKDTYGKFVSCLVFSPRDSFNTELRIKIQRILEETWKVKDVEFNVYFSESILTRLYFVLRLEPGADSDFDIDEIQRKISQTVKSWTDELHEVLIESIGEERGNALFFLYRNAFPASYMEDFSVQSAVADILNIEELRANPKQEIGMRFYRELEGNESHLQFKLFAIQGLLPLSDLLPVIENFGLRVIDEYPYIFEFNDGSKVCVHNLSIVYTLAEKIDMQAVKSLFQQAFLKIWFGQAENDAFNKLVLGSGIDWRDIAMLRGYARYMKQTLFGISEQYIADTLCRYIPLCKLLVQIFNARFGLHPEWEPKHRSLVFREVKKEIISMLGSVEQLNEDRVFRRFLEMINATLRTNFFQTDNKGEYKDYIAFKIEPSKISQMPLPIPAYEIFVYSSRIEGTHLRAGKVARGGLRWSDRNEDFRTEVLGLVKAQQVKNAVIVPVGAKGGFIAKHLKNTMTPDESLEEGIRCYKTFIRALLDVTDNLVEDRVVAPKEVIRHDGDDVYLVVAADKGTATFSDISNAISLERGFWLGDAFASGGSIGYDHKKMAITARGAWVSVQRHFREKGVNVQEENFTVLGIGDMGGDVFGNGMLLSDCIQLTAAFNHKHIFIDPTPDAKTSFKERQRLFNMPRTSWDDYDRTLLSKGGGVYLRSSKSITVTEEMKECFDITEDKLTPTELIKALLKAPVDLIWNGGIGTYIKSSKESHADVGDKANDALRIDGNEVRASVIGEGGNLGLTQLGRVEYSLAGGSCYTDFIDNSAGVDCSDHEVNIKIMLNDLVAAGDLTVKKRNMIFLQMTDAVAQLVLKNNYQQTQAIAFASKECVERLEEYVAFMKTFEESGKLNRSLEFLPDTAAIHERFNHGASLTKPELSVLVSYAKADLKEQLDCDDIKRDSYLKNYVEMAFPAALVKQFKGPIQQHKLTGEIIATQLANDMVNHMGVTYVNRLMKTNGASVTEIAKSYVIARDIFNLHETMQEIYALDYKVSVLTQEQMIYYLVRLIRRASRWFARHRRGVLNVAEEVRFFKAGIETIGANLSTYLRGTAKESFFARYDNYVSQGVDEGIASTIASCGAMLSSLGIIEVADRTGQPIEKVAETYFSLSEALSMDWFSEQVNNLQVASPWQELARASYREDLDSHLHSLTLSVLTEQTSQQAGDEHDLLGTWLESQTQLIEKWQRLLDKIRSYGSVEYSMISVALRELQYLAEASNVKGRPL